MVHGMHGRQEEDNVSGLKPLLVFFFFILLFLTEAVLRHLDMLVLPRSDFHLDVLANESEFLADSSIHEVLLVLYADGIQLFDCQALQSHKALVRRILWVGPQAPVSDEPLHGERVGLVPIADLVHRGFQPGQGLLPVGALGRLAVQVPGGAGVVLEIQQSVLVLLWLLRVWRWQTLHFLSCILCRARSSWHELLPQSISACHAEIFKVILVELPLIIVILILLLVSIFLVLILPLVIWTLLFCRLRLDFRFSLRLDLGFCLALGFGLWRQSQLRRLQLHLVVS
mmetsp:Transcript_4866/g.11389  ORF Transcript_4866/g.11389 Transcript_4866/m.11389 type:complete len:284 (-) Transcript_4866:292-1143(-)